MNIKLFLLATLFIASYASDYSDTGATPNILIGPWTLSNTSANSSAQCCQPTGDLVITNNNNGTVTLTSTNWTGASCGSRNSSYQELIYVNGSYSWTQLQNAYNFHGLPEVQDAQGNEISIDIDFSSYIGTTMSLDYSLVDVSACYSFFNKSAKIMSVFAAVLIAGLNMFIA